MVAALYARFAGLLITLKTELSAWLSGASTIERTVSA